MPLEPYRTGPHEGLRVGRELLDREVKVAKCLEQGLVLNLAPVLISIVYEYGRPRVWDIELDTPRLPEFSDPEVMKYLTLECGVNFVKLIQRMPYVTGFRWRIGKGIWCREEVRQLCGNLPRTENLWISVSEVDEDRVRKDLLGIIEAKSIPSYQHFWCTP